MQPAVAHPAEDVEDGVQPAADEGIQEQVGGPRHGGARRMGHQPCGVRQRYLCAHPPRAPMWPTTLGLARRPVLLKLFDRLSSAVLKPWSQFRHERMGRAARNAVRRGGGRTAVRKIPRAALVTGCNLSSSACDGSKNRVLLPEQMGALL